MSSAFQAEGTAGAKDSTRNAAQPLVKEFMWPECSEESGETEDLGSGQVGEVCVWPCSEVWALSQVSETPLKVSRHLVRAVARRLTWAAIR